MKFSYWFALRTLNQRYDEIEELSQECLALLNEDEKIRNEKIVEKKSEFISKLLSYFDRKEKKPSVKQISLDFSEKSANPSVEKAENKTKEPNNKSENDKSILKSKISENMSRNLEIKHLKRLTDVKEASLIYGIANSEGNLEYLVIPNDKTAKIPNSVRKKNTYMQELKMP